MEVVEERVQGHIHTAFCLSRICQTDHCSFTQESRALPRERPELASAVST